MDPSPSWPLPDRTDLRDALLAAYADPARGYHDTLHLAEVIDRIAELSASTDFDRTVVLLAAWFHDGVYDGQPGAEDRSAEWALRDLPLEVGDRVADLVRMTEHHRPDPADIEACVLSDADLAILAAGPERYADYVTAVRREYAHVPDDLFTIGRSQVLRDLLAKPHLFETDHARTHWEATARANVERELSALAPGASGA